MSSFDQLHPALQHHIVNSLGWRELRPFQEEVIPLLLSGQHQIVLAPTAGGKTEAAIFPTLSRMLSEGWPGLSVLYICPIKALLNNLDVRLQYYFGLLGRQSDVWHGDIKQTARKRILREPPNCLLTTPESLEVMLVSQSVDAAALFANLQVVIIDEIHAFAGDDRGWHLLSVLERISRFAGREPQRIGLSATVGNPETLVDWLAGSCERPRGVYLPLEQSVGDADIKLDYVASLQNAAIVISRLHRGEKRLVFVDSRARAEQLSTMLRGLDVTTFVTHSSLSQEQRKQAEEAFATRNDCVIVATSVLELGIDVGNLDRVIQIDAPTTVSSFLQRMGRTGRRADSTRNCLFLTTKEESLIQAAALIALWRQGFVEPIQPPPLPYHVLAQQCMALALQEGGIGRSEWFRWVAGVQGFARIATEKVDHLVESMVEKQILWDDSGIVWLGQQGEESYGRKNFLELFSVFMSPPLFSVLHGRHELGFVDEMTFLGKHEGPRVLLLGGRAWQVNHIDWARRVAHVEPTDAKGRTRWKGEGQGLGFAMCQAIRDVLAVDDESADWSTRATEFIGEIRHEYSWLDTESSVVIQLGGGAVEWSTFAGMRANATLARHLSQETKSKVTHNSFTITVDAPAKLQDIERAVNAVRERDPDEMYPAVDEAAIDGLKFSDCLPTAFAVELLEHRLQDTPAVRHALAEHIRIVAGQ